MHAGILIPRPYRLTTFIGVIAVTSLVGCGSGGDEKRESTTFEIPNDEVTISKGSGDIYIRPANVDQLEVTRWFTGNSDDAIWKMSAGELTLDTDCGPFSACDIRYEVRVPETTTVTLSGDNGNVTAAGFNTPFAVSTDNGSIQVSDMSGDLTLNSANGDQTATGVTSQNVTANAESGAIDLTFAEAPSDVAITTENGSVTLTVPDVAYSVSTITDSGDIEDSLANDPKSAKTLTVSTESGSITLST
ncbi:DUF4097 family beta strand repeat-containing protein [Cumulibacter soli]|uniref:DUF4097 family beta strand repeat-containing protein n=1 Tax=Cumulibacter soli TaxID=2546344 RepID=UPI001067B1B8|nr:DUF4097 family beta strand repeat-containing protein [Cumulibacter soli]